MASTTLPHGHRRDHRGTPAVRISHVERDRLRDCEALARDVFGHTDLEALPAQQMYTSTLTGGLVLGAFKDDGASIGVLCANPAYDGNAPYLYLASLAIRADFRGHGVGRQLMTAMQAWAVRRGYERIRWTTNALSSRNLFFYLTRCSGRLVGYRRMMYGGLVDAATAPGAVGDEAEIEWRVAFSSTTARRGHRATPIELRRRGRPQRVTTGAGAASAYAVEIPWDVDALRGARGDEVARWRGHVRGAVQPLLARGFVGTSVEVIAGDRRSFLLLERRDARSGS